MMLILKDWEMRPDSRKERRTCFFFDVWKGSYGGICAVDEYLKKEDQAEEAEVKGMITAAVCGMGTMTVEMTVIGWYSIIEFRLMRKRRSRRPCN